MNEYFIKSKNGKINIIEGITNSNCKGIILHVHGVGAHFQFIYSNLDEFSFRDRFFSKFGYKSFGFEFYGHGKSEGLHCSINCFSDLVTDLSNVITHVNLKYPNKPIFICAESMGGAVTLKYIIKSAEFVKQFNVKGIILLSPMCAIDERLKPNPLMIKLLLGISYILPNLQLELTTKKIDSETTTNNEFIKAKNTCLYSFKGPLRLCTVRELFNVSLEIPEQVDKITIPLILFHGLKDKVTTPIGSKIVFDKIKSTDKELVILSESEHCVLIPKNPDDLTPNYVYAKILSWLEART